MSLSVIGQGTMLVRLEELTRVLEELRPLSESGADWSVLPSLYTGLASDFRKDDAA